ncbi:MAG: hypothetical protein HC833_23220 [Leptolyngbyaceae cyanobacterium RM1_406_9]|nr:hypothetical protein [Leptolyngbyaceae cyanobacterium RM1_406_9]
MNSINTLPKALFLSPNNKIYPDYLICSGMISAELDGKPCPFSSNGRLPDPIPLDETDFGYSPDKGKPGDLCPPCAKQQLADLGHWQGHRQQTFPEELLPLRLFKCRIWLWLVIPGLHDAEPTKISTDN